MVLFIKSYPSGKGSSTFIIACNIHVYSIYLVITNGILVLKQYTQEKIVLQIYSKCQDPNKNIKNKIKDIIWFKPYIKSLINYLRRYHSIRFV